jgi:hypothetical protein
MKDNFTSIFSTENAVYCKGSWATGLHALFSVMDEVTFRRTVYRFPVSVKKWHLVVPFLLSTARDFFFHDSKTAENPVSHKFILSQKEAKHLFLCLITLDSCFSHTTKTDEVYLHQICRSRNCHRICLRVALGTWFTKHCCNYIGCSR